MEKKNQKGGKGGMLSGGSPGGMMLREKKGKKGGEKGRVLAAINGGFFPWGHLGWSNDVDPGGRELLSWFYHPEAVFENPRGKGMAS